MKSSQPVKLRSRHGLLAAVVLPNLPRLDASGGSRCCTVCSGQPGPPHPRHRLSLCFHYVLSCPTPLQGPHLLAMSPVGVEKNTGDWVPCSVLEMTHQCPWGRLLTWSSRFSVVEPGLWTLSIETAIWTEPAGVAIKATSSALPFNGMCDPRADPPMDKLKSAGTPSHATMIFSAC